ncbi:MAG TPA: helix-turn-helix domain-containing protein [Polyangiaceae bacterium]|jgi:AraC-like DNA-binding protein
MPLLTRPVSPALRPFVRALWVHRPDGSAAPSPRERVLPTGAPHLVFRFSDAPLRIFDTPDSQAAREVSGALVGGPRSRFYVRDVSAPAPSVGAQLEPGAAALLFGVPADELSERHTSLADLWGPAADEAHARIAEARTWQAQLDAFEAILGARLPRVRGVHPAVADALAHLSSEDGAEIGTLVERSGYSHRFFLSLFRNAVGLTPKVFARLSRFQRALVALRTGRASGAQVAAALGYSDQAHFHRDFVAFSGVAPGRYQSIAPSSPNHVPVEDGPSRFKSVQYGSR